jgi:hypothetical protein
MKKNSFELFQKRIESFLVNDYQYNGIPYYNTGYLELKLYQLKADRICQKVLLSLAMGSILGAFTRYLMIVPFINCDRIFFSFVSLVIIFSFLFLKHNCFSFIEGTSVIKYLEQLLNNNPELINEKIFREKLKNFAFYQPAIELNEIERNSLNRIDSQVEETLINYKSQSKTKTEITARRIVIIFRILEYKGYLKLKLSKENEIVFLSKLTGLSIDNLTSKLKSYTKLDNHIIKIKPNISSMESVYLKRDLDNIGLFFEEIGLTDCFQIAEKLRNNIL